MRLESSHGRYLQGGGCQDDPVASRPTAIVYIDGFNLYYGLLRRTDHRWLNLQTLFEDLLPAYDVIKIRYFTARIKKGANPSDPTAPDRQKAYLNALRSLPKVEVIEGSFMIHKSYARRRYRAKLLGFIPTPRALRDRHVVPIWKVEEKGSDVNLGAYLILDAAKSMADLQVLVTSDSDLVEPVRIVTREFAQDIALCFPHGKQSRALDRLQHKFTLWISNGALARNQLQNPTRVAGTDYYRPTTWAK
jgi:hypothetical protein